MRWPGFFQKFLYSCYGERDERVDTELSPPVKKAILNQRSVPEPALAVTSNAQHTADVTAESSKSSSQQQQSEQSQSETTQQTTQPTSIGSCTKVDSDPDEVTTSKALPQSPTSVAQEEPDPDAITPVTPPATMYANVKDALEDRRKLYDRLRRKSGGQPSTADSEQAPQETPLADGTNAAA